MKSRGIFLLFLFIATTTVLATDIKWKGTTNGSRDPAKTAPKSQKYWDENNIERPDYAKTDAEIAAERGESSPSSKNWIGLIIICCGVAAAYHKSQSAGGSRLGSTSTGTSASPWTMPTGTETAEDRERARFARLARFEALAVQPEKND